MWIRFSLSLMCSFRSFPLSGNRSRMQGGDVCSRDGSDRQTETQILGRPPPLLPFPESFKIGQILVNIPARISYRVPQEADLQLTVSSR